MKSKIEDAIADLYQLPLAEFTHARNALAKSLEGGDRKTVASLVKPSVPLWVINHLYWEDAPTYKALVDASDKLRAAHRSALSGKNVDTRAPDQLHRTTVERAFAKAVALAEKKDVKLSDAARDSVRRTLSALPTEEPAGRMTREPAPVGFSLLSGVKPRPAAKAAEPRLSKAQQRAKALEEQRRKQEEARERKEKEKREREIQKAEQALREAERRLAALKG